MSILIIKLRENDSSTFRMSGLASLLFRRLCPVFAAMLLPLGFATFFDAGSTDAGDLDPTLGVDGKVTTGIGLRDEAVALAIQKDGKIVAAGWSETQSDGVYDGDFVLVRYNVNGSLDSAFGSNGHVMTDFNGDYDIGLALGIQVDGKIIVAGYSGTYPDSDFALVRYGADGSLDITFDSDGKVSTDFGGFDSAYALAIQPDNKIVLAGYTFQPTKTEKKIAVARYNPDGSLDTTFDRDGKVITAVGKLSQAYALALQPDGRIVVAGDTDTYSYSTGGDVEAAMVRYNPDGSLDTSFDGDGIVTTNFTGFYDTAFAVRLQTDGKLIIAGSAGTLPNTDFMLARYNSNGSLDADFGDAGKVVTDISGGDDAARALALQRDGKLILAGYVSITYTTPDFAVSRYTIDGNLDPSFGTNGVSITDFGWIDRAESVALQKNGYIVIAGSTDQIDCDFALARYEYDTPQLAPRVWLPFVMW